MNRDHFQGSRMKALSVGLFILLSCINRASWAKGPEALAEGPPSYLGKQLPETSYAKFTARKLAHARVLWANFDLLREMGVDVPKEGLTAGFEQQIVDAFGYAVPRDFDPPGAFAAQEKTMYADRYGGSGMGNNFGSGRAASVGRVQIKGIGITPLVGAGETFDHGHGGASIEESIREAVWGEINNRELPYGSNRVLAIIDTGTDTVWSDGGKEPRALIVREDPLRPAHFVPVGWGKGPLLDSDAERTKNAIDHLVDAVPADASAATIWEKFESGFKNYVDRVADQYAAAFARSLYHGATSVSNFELGGRYIDYGTQTAQPGFAPIRILEDNDPAGETDEIKAVLIDEFRNGIGARGASAIKELIPNAPAMRREFESRYGERLKAEFLALTGAPPELVEMVMKETGNDAQSSASRLYSEMKKLIEQDARKAINVDTEMPRKLGRHDLREILTRVAKEPNPTAAKLQAALADSIPEQSLRTDFIDAYIAYYGDLLKLAARSGVATSNLATYIREASKIRNRKQVELYRSEMRQNDIRLIDAYKSSGDRDIIWNAINSDIAAGERTYRDAEPFQLVMKETPNLIEGYTLRNVYDARTNQEVMLYRVQIRNGKSYFYGNQIPEGELRKASIRYSSDGWASTREAPAIDHGDFIEFRVIIGPPNPSLTREIDLAMHSSDGRIWWKKERFNVHLKLTPEDFNNPCVLNLQRSWWE